MMENIRLSILSTIDIIQKNSHGTTRKLMCSDFILHAVSQESHIQHFYEHVIWRLTAQRDRKDILFPAQQALVKKSFELKS